MKLQIESFITMIWSTWRFRKSALVTAWICGVVGALTILALPSQYESRAQIFVDTQSVLRPLLQGIAVSPETRDQTDIVRHALLSRPSLDRVARETGLYNGMKSDAEREKFLTEFADMISIHGEPGSGLYSISYPDSDAYTSYLVVKTLLDTFVNKSLGAGRTDTQNAENFLAKEVASYESRLSDSEQKLAEFKKQHVGMMPDQRGDYFLRLQQEAAAVEKLQTSLDVARRQRDELRRKIAGDARDANDANAAVISPTPQEIQAATSIDARIHESRRQLDDLLLKFTDQHPEVIALKASIAQLEERRRRELGGVRATSAGTSQSSSLVGDPVMQNLQISLNTSDVQVAALEEELVRARSSLAEVKQKLSSGPEVEAELARLNRDYGVTKAQYEALLQRLESARISKNADRTEDLQLKVIEPPQPTLRPVRPNRRLFLGALFALSVLAGCAVAYLFASTQPVFFSKAAIRESLELPVIGVVSLAYSAQQVSARRRDYLRFAVIILALAGTIGFVGALDFSASEWFRHVTRLDRL